MAERMEFEPPVFPVGRIGSESEPPNLATEINADCGACHGPELAVSGSDSPCPSPKTPRNARGFGLGRGLRAQSLCNRRLVGGESGIRTHGTFRYTRFPSVRLKPLGHLSGSSGWRRGRDSNPRWVSPHTPLAGERLQPLGHLSARATECNGFLAEREGFEPSRRASAWRFSRPLPSTTRPPLRTKKSRTWKGIAGPVHPTNPTLIQRPDPNQTFTSWVWKPGKSTRRQESRGAVRTSAPRSSTPLKSAGSSRGHRHSCRSGSRTNRLRWAWRSLR